MLLLLLLAVVLAALPGCDNHTQSYPPPADAATRDAILRAVFGDSNFTLLGPTGRKEYPGLDRDKVFRTVIEHARAAGFTGRPDSISYVSQRADIVSESPPFTGHTIDIGLDPPLVGGENATSVSISVIGA